ncbi:MAG: ATP-binding protein [Candidatus Woesearchaeota archaeon]
MIRKEKLRKVIDSQREWIKNLDSGIIREELSEISIPENRALIISGIRRCGKSTLLKQILEDVNEFYYLNLEDPRLEGFELDDFNKSRDIFKNQSDKGVYFFDEIQNIDKWENFIRFLVDRNEKVVITGSNASLLSRELGSKLTGRHKTIELFPFNYREFLRYKEKEPSKETYKEFLFKGGFPNYLKEEDPTYLNDLLKDVIMRDIAIRHNIKNTSVLEKLALYLLSHTGDEFSYNSLKKTFNVKSVQSIIDYVSFFEDSYLLFTIPMFSYSYKKQQVNPKKTFSIDNGFSSANTVSFSEDYSKMLENSVFLELNKKYDDIFYYQNKKECDFVVKKKNEIVNAYQVCYKLNDHNLNREINGLYEAMDKFNLEKGLILTYDDEDQFKKNDKTIIVKPVWKWLTE